MNGDILSVLGMLAVTVVILGLTYWFTKHVVGQGLAGRLGPEKGKGMSVLGQLSLGKGQRLAVVRLGQRCLLLGVTDTQVSLLTELTEEEAAHWLEEGQPAPETLQRPGSFLEILRNTMSQKK